MTSPVKFAANLLRPFTLSRQRAPRCKRTYFLLGSAVVRHVITRKTFGSHTQTSRDRAHCKNAGCEKLSTILGLRSQSTSRWHSWIPKRFKRSLDKAEPESHFRLWQLGKSLLGPRVLNMILPATRDEAIEYLFARIDYERKVHVPYSERNFKLDRMRDLARRLGNPQQKLEIIHIAGTKGKGSTSTMLASVLTANGYRTGLFTSPHLQRLEERIKIDEQPIPAEDFTSIVRRLIPILQSMESEDSIDNRPTFFEIVTAIALLHFEQQKVDTVVLEVGLGGRLDSTNICTPRLCIITEIDLDHTRQLGDTLEKIAAEKAGIIKPGIPVICGVQKDEPLQVIRAKAEASNCDFFALRERFAFRYHAPQPKDRKTLKGDKSFREKLDFYFDGSGLIATHNAILNPILELPDIEFSMMGEHQAVNTSMALAAANVLQSLGYNFTESATRKGLLDARCRARIELMATAPDVILDVGHNGAAILALTETLESHFSQQASERIVIIALTRGKPATSMLRRLLPWCAHLIVTQYVNNPRGRDPAEIAEICEKQSTLLATRTASVNVCSDPGEAWKMAHELANPQSLICITGSFFLASELEPLIRPTNTPLSDA